MSFSKKVVSHFFVSAFKPCFWCHISVSCTICSFYVILTNWYFSCLESGKWSRKIGCTLNGLGGVIVRTCTILLKKFGCRMLSADYVVWNKQIFWFLCRIFNFSRSLVSGMYWMLDKYLIKSKAILIDRNSSQWEAIVQKNREQQNSSIIQ